MMIEYNDSYKLKQGPSFASADTYINDDSPKTHTLIHYHSDMELLFIEDGKIVLTSQADRLREKENASIDEVFRRMFKC